MDLLKNKILEAVKKVARTEKVTLDSKFIDELGIDSLGFIRLVIELETKHGLSFEDNELDMTKFHDARSIYEHFATQSNRQK